MSENTSDATTMLFKPYSMNTFLSEKNVLEFFEFISADRCICHRFRILWRPVDLHLGAAQVFRFRQPCFYRVSVTQALPSSGVYMNCGNKRLKRINVILNRSSTK